jgi:hypothetical protein
VLFVFLPFSLGKADNERIPGSLDRTDPAQPLPLAVILKVENGKVPGEVVIQVKPIPKALSYEAHYTSDSSDGKPGAWTLLPPFTNLRRSPSRA